MAAAVGHSGLVGRDRDVRAIAGLVTQSRLITLLGPGGVGKTRLAIEVADELETEFDRVQFLDLTAQSAGGRFHVAGEVSGIDMSPSLLVVDNCEHVVDDAAVWLAELLRATPTVVIATSRRPLSIAGERVYLVRPLSVPPNETSAADLLAYEAVQLLIERAVQVDPTFELNEGNAHAVTRICQLSGGLPIALELAAGLVASRTMSSIVDAMAGVPSPKSPISRRDVHPHQQSLVTSVEWSLSLLDSDERGLLDCAATFRDTFDAEALGFVHESVGGTDAQALLDQLVAHSLVTFDRAVGRYVMLNVIASTVRAATDGAVALDLEEAHGGWALDRSAKIASLANEPDPDQAFAGYHRDLGDLAFAAQRFDREGRAEDWLRLVGPVAPWWVHQGGPVDAGRWRSAAFGGDAPTRSSVSLGNGLAFHLGHTGQYEESIECAVVALEQAEALGATDLAIGALTALGNAYLSQGQGPEAKASYLRALEVGRDGADDYLRCVVLICLARVAHAGAEQRDRLKAAIDISSGAFPALYVVALQNLSRLELGEGNLAAASELAGTSSRLAAVLGYDEALATAHNTDGMIASHGSDLAAAEVAHRAAVAIGRRIGHLEIIAEGLIGLAEVCVVQRDGATAAELVGHALRLSPNLEVPTGLATVSDAVDGPVLPTGIGETLAKVGVAGREHAPSTRDALLTAREQSVLLLLRGDLTQREIADELYVSPSTVRTHVKSIYKKLGVHNRTSCVHAATTQGLLPPP